jgi:signal transduction histidine kinase
MTHSTRSVSDWLRNPGLRRKGFLILVIPLLFDVVFALAIVKMDRMARRHQEDEIRATSIAASSHQVAGLLVDAETSIRGYIITAQPRFTEPYLAARDRLPAELSRLAQMTPELHDEVSDVSRRAAAVLEHQTAQFNRVREGRREEAAANVVMGVGKELMDRTRQSLARLHDGQRRLSHARTSESRNASHRLLMMILGGVAVNVIGAGSVAWFVINDIRGRLNVITGNMDRLESGGHLSAPLAGRDEISQLDRRFHDMAAALARSHEELATVNRELEAFSYSVSHDLRAPLRAVSGYSRMIDEDYADRLDEPGRRYLAAIASEASRMGQLIDDLLSFSRVGRTELSLVPVDVGELAREALSLSGANGHDIRFDVTPLPKALADRNLLRQVLVNLVSNAIKFSSKKPSIEIEVGAKREGEQNVYWVRDRGAGFDMRYSEKLFGVFQRLHSLEDFQGTGVGLAIVQRIIHRHGGRVWAEGQPGAGACFYFALPDAEGVS